MGLDMYLHASAPLEESKRKDLFKVLNVPGKSIRGSDLKLEAAYWRKANQIHGWFVKNVADGEDDCSNEYYVSKDSLRKLLDTINAVLTDKSKAKELLPPMQGFFFGSTDVDEWYWEQLTNTKEILEELLTDPYKDWSFSYKSSW